MEVKTMNKDIKRRLAKLDALERGGVENWEWYGESLKEWFAENELEEEAQELCVSICEILAASAYEPSERGAGVTFPDASVQEVVDLIAEKLKRVKSNDE